MKSLLISVVLLTSPVVAGDVVVCSPFTYSAPQVVKQFHGGYSNSFVQSYPVVQKVVAQSAYPAQAYTAPAYDGGVVGALQEIAKQKQEYQAMIEGLQALGYSSSVSASASVSSHVPYAQAPYEQGTTAYAVKEVQVDAFGPQDVRELIAAVSRYSTEANTGANQLMGQATQITSQISASVQANSDAALRIATIDAETRGVEATANAVIEALRITRPQQQTSYTEREYSADPADHPVPADPSPMGTDFPLIEQTCIQCHSPAMAEPKGGFRFSASLSANDVMIAADQVVRGDMPPESNLTAQERLMIVAELQRLLPEGE